MMRAEKIAICLACGLAFNAGLRAADTSLKTAYVSLIAHRLAMRAGLRAGDIAPPNIASPDNPYASIAARNIFGLNPPQPVSKADTSAPDKITLNGITTLFGTPQALFKVEQAARFGRPGSEESYILSEGQSQDNIEVVHVDEQKGTVTFNNQGVIEDISLTAAPATATPATPASFHNFHPPLNGAVNGGAQVFKFGNRFNQNRNFNNGSVNFQGGGNNYQPSSSVNQQSQNPLSSLSADDRAVIIAANHAAAP